MEGNGEPGKPQTVKEFVPKLHAAPQMHGMVNDLELLVYLSLTNPELYPIL
jgi:hypothetical protein